ncbi:hypothetical protein Y032_0156g3105 [Ancylostoma ceylanicum]|uniref:Uncharacterized protein n=1 Tax=Ancylostoma ceylanicum TaxID=53326 RepID=A0A016SY96_9BILA|nr:hypothetical protein Y032_0156g3105 [Ancylostoma ceylanicum]
MLSPHPSFRFRRDGAVAQSVYLFEKDYRYPEAVMGTVTISEVDHTTFLISNQHNTWVNKHTVRVDGGDHSMASTRTPGNRAARAGIVVVSRWSATSRRFSSQFDDLFTFFMFHNEK